MKRRVLLGGFFQETHSFVDVTTAWDDFKVARGAEIFAKLNDGSVTDGFLDEAAKHDLEVIPALDAWALPGGVVEDAAFEQFWREFEATARPALLTGLEAIFLVLHGAMVTPAYPDAEGELLARIRALPGAAALPIFGVLDLHANVTAAMCRHANGLVAYGENPHTDARETGQRATRLLARCLREGCVPHMTWCRPPLLWAPPATGTQADPMLTLTRFARKVEQEHPHVWACNVLAGFAFADMPDSGVSFSVVSTGAVTADRRLLQAAAELAWSRREQGRQVYPPVDEVVAAIAKAPPAVGGEPVLLVEPADNIGGGAPGDGTGILRSLVKYRADRALVVLNDPAAVAALANVRTGEVKRLALGGRGSRLDAGPVELDVVFVSRSDGAFDLEDTQSHLVAMCGLHFEMGPCAVVRSAGITLLLTSRKTPPFDLGQLRSQGLEPRDFAIIGIKAAVAHKRAYDRISSVSHYVDTPGPCTSNLARLPWRRLHRPVWPLDPTAILTCRFS